MANEKQQHGSLESVSSTTKKGEASKNTVKEGLKKFMEERVLQMQTPAFPPSIYKVPKELRNGHDKIFKPISVPIGPLHYDESCAAQKLKKWCLKNFIERFEDKYDGLETLAECMSQLELQVRQCYQDIGEKESQVLMEIMLLDGCFIMELLWNMGETHYNRGRKPFDSVLDAVPFLTLQQDLLKIENQLPFIVLKSLARLAPEGVNKKHGSNHKKDKNEDEYLIELALNFFDIPKTDIRDTPRHLLELVMNALFHDNPIPGSVPINMQTKDNDDKSLVDARSASELEFYGIRFHAADSRNMANIEFKRSSGQLWMPKLNIQESTLWNLMIFEMLFCMTRFVSSYVVLMGTLIENEKDVEVLLGARILASRGGDARSMVAMFTELSATVNKNKKDFFFGSVLKEVNNYCESKYPKMRAKVVRKCYDSRWELLNNILLFVLTSTQTMFSVLGYYPKPKGA